MRSSLNIYAVVVILACLLSTFVNAAQTGDNYKFKLTGKLVKMTWCNVNNDQPINVSFGNVGVKKVATGEYVQDINYSIVCNEVTNAATVEMTLRATASGWDDMAMSTDVGNLGVHILKDGQPISLNTAIKIVPNTTPKLQAQLVQKPDALLPECAFRATGTLIVEYK